jgi:hypothetical protein
MHVFVSFGFRYRKEEECSGSVQRSLAAIYLSRHRTWNRLGPGNDDLSAHYHEIPCLVHLNFAAMTILNYLIITVSLCTLLLFVVVVSKPKYDRALALDGSFFRDAGWLRMALSRVHALLHSVTDGFPPAVYYAGYSTICFLMQFYYPPLSCYLLLDIVVKSKTTVSVLMAVYKPRKQLTMTLFLLIVVVYILTVNYFFSFRLDNRADMNAGSDCFSLLSCFISGLNNGMRYGGGFGDQMQHRVFSGRVSLDLIFFWVVMIILINIVFGIIIDTFANLREEMELREDQTNNFCFACGISSETFDRSWQQESTVAASNSISFDLKPELTGWKRHFTLVMKSSC